MQIFAHFFLHGSEILCTFASGTSFHVFYYEKILFMHRPDGHTRTIRTGGRDAGDALRTGDR